MYQKDIAGLIIDAVGSLQQAAKFIDRDINEALKSKSVVPVVEVFAKLRYHNAALKEVKTALKDLEDRLSHTSIPDHFKLCKTKNIGVEGVGRIAIGHTWYCSILDKAGAYKFLRDRGNGSLITETINAQTLGAFAHDLSDTKGITLPGELFKTTVTPYTSITK
jgi:hypothetical protein